MSCSTSTGSSSVTQGHMQWEKEILSPLAGSGRLFAYPVVTWWSQIKTAGSAIYANRHYLELYRRTHPERLAHLDTATNDKMTTIIPDVYIHPKACVHPTAVLGPNVSIGAGVNVGPGVRIRESIILENAIIRDHTLILHSVVGRGSTIGEWARVEGTPSDPDPNKPFAKMENPPLFNNDGRLNPSITILGKRTSAGPWLMLINKFNCRLQCCRASRDDLAEFDRVAQ